MSEAQRRARQQERIESLCAATIRALSGVRDLHFRGRRLYRGRRALPFYAPHLATSLEADDFASFRGAADSFGLRLANSDAVLHQALAPGDAVERMVFELLEQFRCEALVPAGMDGVRRNLRHRFETWSLGFHHEGGTETARGLLMFALVQMSRSRLTGDAIVEELEDLLEATRAGVGPLIGSALAGCKRERADQAAYALHALSIARSVAALLQAPPETGDDDASERDETDGLSAFFTLLPSSDEFDDGVAQAVSGRSLVLDGADDGYRVFTTTYDREVDIGLLVRADLQAEYRERLDRRIAASGVDVAHVARDFKALLAEPTRDGWDSGQEEGTIDGRRLAQLIVSPTERRLFRIERHEPVADCLVSVLIDCSGSMKEHIESVAMLVDLLARALERAGVACEILGFTTSAWNGGRAQRDWSRAGRPRHPGRLNEACHLLVKPASTTWRRARPNVAALLKADLFREGIDGEAVDWAMRRQQARDEARKLLIVISDGSPMDSATHLANDAHYLDHHLKDVVLRHEAAGAEIYGVGVGLDLSPYYSRSHVLDLSASVGMATFREIVAMIGRRFGR